MKFALKHSLPGLLAAMGLSVGATDIATVDVPSPVADQRLAVGERALILPEGAWTVISKTAGAITIGGGRATATHTAYAVRAKDGDFQAAMVLSMPVNSAYVTGWNDEPCKVDSPVFRDTLQGRTGFPECLVVTRQRRHLQGASGPLYQEAERWMAANGVRFPGETFHVAYSRYAANDYGVARVFIPASNASEEQVVRRARTLPDALSDLFARKATSAALPAFDFRK